MQVLKYMAQYMLITAFYLCGLPVTNTVTTTPFDTFILYITTISAPTFCLFDFLIMKEINISTMAYWLSKML